MNKVSSETVALHAVRELAQTLKAARIALGLSQRELAKRAGLGQSRLALIEQGRVDLRASTLAQLARALDFELVLTPRHVLPAVESLTKRRSKEISSATPSLEEAPPPQRAAYSLDDEIS